MASVPCPLCGEPVPRGVRRCDNCGSVVPDETVAGAQALAETLKVDPETARKLAESGFQPGEVREESGGGSTLYLCPSCGAFVSSADATCAHCGAALERETSEGEARPCPHCGSEIPSTAEECPACGKRVAEEPSETIRGLCPNCGSVAPTGQATCAVCGASLRPSPAPPKPPVEEAAAEVPTSLPPRAEPAPAPKATPKVVPKPRAIRAPRPVAVRPRPVARPPTVPVPEARASGDKPRPRVPQDAAPVPRISIPIARASAAARIDTAREIIALGTAIALPVAAAAALARTAGREWGDLFLFGVLFGLAIPFTLAGLRGTRDRVPVLAWGVALGLWAATPVLGFLGSSAAPVTLGLGAALLALSVWRLRAGAGIFLAWTSGLLLLTILATGPILFLSAGPSESSMWALGALCAFGGSLLLVVRRFLRSAADARLERADRAYAKRDYAGAVTAYDAAVRLARRAGRENAAGWYGKGAALVAIGKLDDAIGALDRAVALNPENEIAWINKGTALVRLGRTTEGLRCFNSAIKVNPRYEVAWNNKGNALARLGRREMALACYDRAIQIDPAYRTAWVNKGYVLAKLGRFDEAATCADAALRLTAGASSA